MTIAQELENRMWYLADSKIRWVRGTPHRPGQSCLMLDAAPGLPTQALSRKTTLWLLDFMLSVEDCFPSTFNDHAPCRRSVIERLEEAVDQARWEGV